mgnify:CR=1 FL=1
MNCSHILLLKEKNNVESKPFLSAITNDIEFNVESISLYLNVLAFKLFIVRLSKDSLELKKVNSAA